MRVCARVGVPQIMQLVLSPATMLMDPLVGKYLRGVDKVGIYEETLDMCVVNYRTTSRWQLLIWCGCVQA